MVQKICAADLATDEHQKVEVAFMASYFFSDVHLGLSDPSIERKERRAPAWISEAHPS